MDAKIVKGMLLGLAVGDALGVPVEFDSRKSLFSEDFDATRKRIFRNREYVNGKMIPVGS